MKHSQFIRKKMSKIVIFEFIFSILIVFSFFVFMYFIL